MSLGAGIAALLVARASLADHYRVPSGSMQPTVHEGDRIIVNKLAYGLRVPLTETYLAELSVLERGDVVVLASPDDGTVLLKRVVALPGDRAAVLDGEVFLNGRLAPHAYAIRREGGGGPDLSPLDVPAGAYLVLGDNRGNSRDGRSFGLVPRSAILGKAVAVYARDGSLVWLPL
ncbi:MAG: signal peptidase I [Myxococcales bacterium]|nr:signal peptidase I [Myxococcales bacterium]